MSNRKLIKSGHLVAIAVVLLSVVMAVAEKRSPGSNTIQQNMNNNSRSQDANANSNSRNQNAANENSGSQNANANSNSRNQNAANENSRSQNANANSNSRNENAANENSRSQNANASGSSASQNENTARGQTVASPTMKMSSQDHKFVMDAAMDGMMEVELGRLATQNGMSDSVKQFGQRMVDDHSKSNTEMMRWWRRKALRQRWIGEGDVVTGWTSYKRPPPRYAFRHARGTTSQTGTAGSGKE